MTSTHKFSLITLAALGTLIGAPAFAQSYAQEGNYYYWGLGAGQARTRFDDARITGSLAPLATTAITHDERDNEYKVFLGYQFNRNVGVELGYFHLGSFGYSATTTPAGTLKSETRVQGASLGLVGTLPLTENLSALARLGVQYARTRTTNSGTGAVVVANASPSDREANAKIGVGLQYAISPSFLLRGEVERYRISDAMGNHPQVATYSVSAVFPFGRAETAPRRAMATPMYEAPVAAAAPAPVYEAPPPVVLAPLPKAEPIVAFAPPTTRKVSYAAESFFAFDRTELQPEGKRALDSFVSQLSGASFERITVQGYADRLGTVEYNQTLSLARAEAVKDYLVKTGGLDATRIITAGRSEGEPVTLPDACKGPQSAAVIACLQPDRRVEIEVAGTR